MSVVDLDCVVIQHCAQLLHDHLSHRFDSQHIQYFLDVVAVCPFLVYVGDAQHLLEIYPVCLQNPLAFTLLFSGTINIEKLFFVGFIGGVQLGETFNSLDDEVLAHQHVIQLLE